MPEIVAVRTAEAETPPEHDHVVLVGYRSSHIQREPIMIAPQRVHEKALVLEKFWVTVEGEKVAVVSGKCPVCGHEPYLRTQKDAGDEELLKGLPES